MIHCAGSRVHTDGLHAVQLHTDSATGSVPKTGKCRDHTHRGSTCNRGSMQQRVHATFHARPVPTLAFARALASPALASPVLTACARLHTHILRSAHLHRACRSLLCHLALLVEVRFCLTFGNRLVEAHIHSTTLILRSQKQLARAWAR